MLAFLPPPPSGLCLPSHHQTTLAYATASACIAFFLFYVLLFGLYVSAETATNLVLAWAWTQVRLSMGGER